MDDASVRQHHLDSEEVIATCAVAKPPRAAGVGGQQRADGQTFGMGRVERQPLAAAGKVGLQSGEREARLDRHRHVVGLMLDDAVQSVQMDAADLFAARVGIGENPPELVQTGWFNDQSFNCRWMGASSLPTSCCAFFRARTLAGLGSSASSPSSPKWPSAFTNFSKLTDLQT